MKQWIALTVLGAVAIMAAGWFLLVSPKRAEAAALQEQAELQLSANSAAETRLEILRAKAKELPKKQAELAKVAAKIPTSPGLPNLIRELNRASADAGVEFVSVTPGAPAPLTVAAPAAGAPAVTAAAPAAGAAGALTAIPVNINVVGDFYDVEHFLAELEDLGRALRVTNVTMAPGQSPVSKRESNAAVEDGSSLNATITGTVFMAASAPAQTAVVAPPVAGAAPAAPAPVAPAPAAPTK